MQIEVDFTQLRTSWTKYDIVRVMEVIENLQILDKYLKREAKIDGPILRSFLGIQSLKDPLPEYWSEIQNYPSEKKLFALFAALFTHGEVISDFAHKYSTGDKKGLFTVEGGKQYTNIRSALIESGAAQKIYRRTKEVPYDFSPIFQNGKVGKLFKKVLIERISRLTKKELIDPVFYEICFMNNFHKALSLSKSQFKSWLEDTIDIESSYIEKIQISNFFSIDNIKLDFSNAKEVYFLGENGDGKSLILMAIYLAFKGNFVTEKTDQEKTGRAADIIRSNRNTQLIGIDDRGIDYNPQKGIYLNNIFAYGANRGRYSADKPEEYGFMSLFDNDQTLKNPVTWLTGQNAIELEQIVKKGSVSEESKKVSNSISVTTLKTMFFELLERNVEFIIEKNNVKFKEKGFELSFDQLSEGYRSIIIFVSDLICRLIDNTKQSQKFTDLKGVVLVDEIDLHLHPKWQRVVVKKLRNLFPNIQFVFTTHSPSMIQGASEDAIIYRVYRNSDDGKTRVSDPYFRKDLDHLMINTLLTSQLFGLNDSRMNPDDENADTSDTYLLYRINLKLEEELINQRNNGKQFIKDEEIDKLIQKIIKEELGSNDKSK